MQAIDGINQRFGRNQIHFAIQGTDAETDNLTDTLTNDQPAGFLRPHKV
jgi:hypothetical protein